MEHVKDFLVGCIPVGFIASVVAPFMYGLTTGNAYICIGSFTPVLIVATYVWGKALRSKK